MEKPERRPMDIRSDNTPMAQWTVDSHREPVVRIGVVLPEDGDTEVCLEVPPGGYRAAASSGAGRAGQPIAGRVTARCRAGGVALATPEGDRGLSERWRIVPHAGGGADVPCVRLHNIVAGRGFHWEKRIDEDLPGSLEIAQADGRILLVNELPIDAYLKGVITAEMGGQCPMDLLKAQCVTARTWMLARTERKHEKLRFDYCNDDCCQRYQGYTHLTPSGRQAVDETRGEIMIHRNGSIIDANYSKSCGGICEAPEPVWGVAKPGQHAVADAPFDSYARGFLPVRPGRLDEYLTGDWLKKCDVFCSPNVVPNADLPRYLGAVDEGGGYFRWAVEYPREALEDILRRKFFARKGFAGNGGGMVALEDLTVTRRGMSGRAISLNVVYRSRDGHLNVAPVHDQYWIRHALHEKFLYSSAFAVGIRRDDAGLIQTVRFTGAGWGHGAGLCQIGALGMALVGHEYTTILHHYFERMRIERVYD